MASAVMAQLSGAINRGSLPVVVRRHQSLGSRPFMKDREEAGDVLDNLPGVLTAEGALGPRLPEVNGSID